MQAIKAIARSQQVMYYNTIVMADRTTKGRPCTETCTCAKETRSSASCGEQNIRLQSVIIFNGGLNKKEGTRSTKCNAMEGARASVIKLVQKLPLEWIGLSVVLLVVWGLLLLPIIYFHTEIVSEFN